MFGVGDASFVNLLFLSFVFGLWSLVFLEGLYFLEPKESACFGDRSSTAAGTEEVGEARKHLSEVAEE